MEVKVLGSSSKGNCYLINNEIILEAGINPKHIKEALDFDLSTVKGCFVSHLHGDHAKYLQKILDLGIDCYSSKETFEHMNIKSHRAHLTSILKPFEVEGYVFTPFETQHDCKGSQGCFITNKKTGEKLMFATDTYYIKYKATGLNYILIECNYAEKYLKDSPRPEIVKSRVRESHMSLDNLKDYLSKIDLTSCSNIVLLHLSEGHADPQEFKSEIEKVTGIKTDVAEKGKILKLGWGDAT